MWPIVAFLREYIHIYVYMYIYREREKEKDNVVGLIKKCRLEKGIYIYIYIYIYEDH